MRTYKAVEKIPDDVISMMFDLPAPWRSKFRQENQDAKLKITVDFLNSKKHYSDKQINILGKSFSKRDLSLITDIFNQAIQFGDRRFVRNTVDFIMSAIFNKSGYEASRVRSEIKSDFENENKYYPYISFMRCDFIKILQKVNGLSKTKDRRTKKFIDVGCGIGDKVLFANLLGYNSYGIEYNEHTYNLGKHFLNGIDYCSLIHGDAFSHDFSEYDVIYLYVPIDDRKLMIELHRHIYSTMKVGAKMYDVGTGVNQLYGNIFNKDIPRRRNTYGRYVIQKRRDGKPRIRMLKNDSSF